MLILAFDTTNNSTSVCLAQDDKILQKITIQEAGQQSEKLISLFEEILKNNKIWYQDLNLIAYTNGPGSFTGVRIGLTTAKTLHLTTKIPLLALNSTEVISYKYFLKYGAKFPKISVVIDAKSDELFVAKFNVKNDVLEMTQECCLLSLENINNYFSNDEFLAGSGKKIVAQVLGNNNFDDEEDLVEADLIAILAYEKYKQNPDLINDERNHQAFYAREPKISQRKNG